MTLTIAVLAYNQPQLVQQMQDQLGTRMVLVDNGSEPALEYPGRTIRLSSNGYFAGGWNESMRVMDSDWIAMLNSDIQGVSVALLESLVEKAEHNHLAAISPAFNSPHQHMQSHGLGVREVAWLDWTAVVMRKDAWESVGEFNNTAFPGYGADIDWCYRAKQRGYRLGVDDHSPIQHIGSVTALAEGLQHIQGNVERMNQAFSTLYGVSDWTQFVSKFLEA